MQVITELDLRKLLSRQRWFDRLTGADVEARFRFELSAKQVNLAFERLKGAADQARALIKAMVVERIRLGEEQEALAAAIVYADGLSGARDHADEYLVQRFDRRVANLNAMHAANAMAIEQFKLAENNLTALLDRYSEIASLLIPLWQQHLFTLLHASGRLRRNDPDVASFFVCHSALEEYFVGEART
ncbi:hypothetical protein JJB09_08500 [Rhizobium sp. KVB221]|uniref:Uncharacterized protein n=1 Tax=Rhizobium setariae TaxID=2801340 RepID=A0A937CLV1_9HYPH|nr:hypothetical protein [Rhizobium setariae]MBL0372066.1 hypothetical protein [Rhizobium setariae]